MITVLSKKYKQYSPFLKIYAVILDEKRLKNLNFITLMIKKMNQFDPRALSASVILFAELRYSNKISGDYQFKIET